ncbi:putative receptor-type tyrosine-protein phosphatase H [Scophthalmus maximus]|uniref:protein-tyrosine-phosphatase n=1 Tax=Scophthalmus maximus TaxID=52904 RepID=A0A2U9CM30_SCOMX|nr:putative receptor-type tyrosine-protein phosphatase H [Scophthalmus maximus]
MRKPFSSTSDRLLLCVFWTLLWGVTGSIPSTPNTAQTAIATPTDATEAETTSTLLTIPMTTIPTTKPPPGDAKDFELVGQNETSVTLQWKKVENILTYTLVFPGREINITALVEAELWKKVEHILTYTLGFSGGEINVTALVEDELVTHTIPDLSSGTEYSFSLVTVFASVKSSGVNHTAVTVPPSLSARCEYRDAGYSIFLVWNKPDGVWTAVEVNVTGQTHLVPEDGKQHVEISGFHPARTYAVSLSSLSGTERSYEPFVFLCSTDPRGVIAGSVVTLLLFGVVVCLVVFILFHRPHLIRKTPFYSGSKLSSKRYRTISVAEFPGHFSQLSVDSNRGFGQEYESLAPVGTKQKQKAADLPENNVKNRFSNVLPYDWCRVKLTTSRSEGNSDYINASFIPGHRSRREYIATQGPLPSTVNDFWTMVWEQRVKGIVMVTNCIEGGRTKCEQYWPEDSNPGLYQELLITLRSKEQEPYWILREFIVKHRYTSEERTVKHFHFTAWPDHGVPQGTKALIQFRRIMRWHMEREGVGAPTVVHCSAGVGRTGTIIALDVLLQQLDQKRAVSVGAFVHKLRLSRPHMVQTETQYVFLHQCIMDCLQQDEKTEDNYNLDLIYVNATVLQEFR